MLNTAPRRSPFLRVAEDMRLAHNLHMTNHQIMDLMIDYKDNGHDTVIALRSPDGHRDRRFPYVAPRKGGGKDTTEDAVDRM
jgi:hypothetical protein